MSNVIDLGQHRLKKQPHVSGWVTCMSPECKHTWVGVAPVERDTDLECPKCGLVRGVWSMNFTVPEGDLTFTCNGCESQYYKVGRASVTCIGCGATSTFEELTEIATR